MLPVLVVNDEDYLGLHQTVQAEVLQVPLLPEVFVDLFLGDAQKGTNEKPIIIYCTV